jgi:hypothetical protein
MKEDTYQVIQADERKIPWPARRKLRRARHERRTGLLAYSRIPGGTRGMTWNWRVVVVHEGGRRLFSAGPGLQLPKWVDLPPGYHSITFAVGGYRSVEFSKEFILHNGDILLVGCRTHYSRRRYPENPRPNIWSISIV